jgi:hypothetical protein
MLERLRLYDDAMPSIEDPVFDEPRERPGFDAVRARLGRQAGSQRLGLSLWEVPAGEAATTTWGRRRW